jgi:hypothetical protein
VPYDDRIVMVDDLLNRSLLPYVWYLIAFRYKGESFRGWCCPCWPLWHWDGRRYSWMGAFIVGCGISGPNAWRLASEKKKTEPKTASASKSTSTSSTRSIQLITPATTSLMTKASFWLGREEEILVVFAMLLGVSVFERLHCIAVAVALLLHFFLAGQNS